MKIMIIGWVESRIINGYFKITRAQDSRVSVTREQLGCCTWLQRGVGVRLDSSD